MQAVTLSDAKEPAGPPGSGDTTSCRVDVRPDRPEQVCTLCRTLPARPTEHKGWGVDEGGLLLTLCSAACRS